MYSSMFFTLDRMRERSEMQNKSAFMKTRKVIFNQKVTKTIAQVSEYISCEEFEGRLS